GWRQAGRGRALQDHGRRPASSHRVKGHAPDREPKNLPDVARSCGDICRPHDLHWMGRVGGFRGNVEIPASPWSPRNEKSGTASYRSSIAGLVATTGPAKPTLRQKNPAQPPWQEHEIGLIVSDHCDRITGWGGNGEAPCRSTTPTTPSNGTLRKASSSRCR